MKRRIKLGIFVLGAAAVALPAFAQSPKLQFNLDRLAQSKNIVETVNITLERNLLEMMMKWLPKNDPDTAKLKQLVQGLQGIYVRSFKFDKEGAYSSEDVEAIRKQLTAPAWACMVQVRSKRAGGENADICLRQENDKILGLAIVATEPKELTVVNIIGSISPDQLSDLEGRFIPQMHEKKKPPKSKEESREKDKDQE